MLKFDAVDLHYGSFKALNGISLNVREGELVVLLGANGAGKTSIFMAASGMSPIKSGQIAFRKKSIGRLSPAQLVREGLVHCPEGRKLFPMMSVRENLELGAYAHGQSPASSKPILEEIYSMFPIVSEKQNHPAGSLSGGQQQMVAIGRALMGRPRLLLLDEPSLGLAPLVVKQMFDVIKRINGAGTTVLLAEQNAYSALAIADRAYVIERGTVALEGDRASLLGNEAVRRAYIGG